MSDIHKEILHDSACSFMNSHPHAPTRCEGRILALETPSCPCVVLLFFQGGVAGWTLASAGRGVGWGVERGGEGGGPALNRRCGSRSQGSHVRMWPWPAPRQASAPSVLPAGLLRRAAHTHTHTHTRTHACTYACTRSHIHIHMDTQNAHIRRHMNTQLMHCLIKYVQHTAYILYNP